MRSFHQRSLVLIVIFSLAFILRLVWNIWIHPPQEYLYSDMYWYDHRANMVVQSPLAADPSFVFFPYGTHYLLAAIKLLFGVESYWAIGIFLAFLGALVPVFTYLIASRLTAKSGISLGAAAITIFYYPLISLGGYVLSEVPFCVGLLASTYCLLRLIDSGKPRDAYWMGIASAITVAIRPQMILFVLGWVGWWFFTRHLWPRVRPALLLRAAVPIVLILIFSCARFYYHTHEFGGVSANGSLNMMFGRCHPVSIAATTPGNTVSFGLPEFSALKNAAFSTPPAFLRLAPAIAVPEVITYEGSIADKAVHRRYIAYCMERTGWTGQLYYSLTHTVLLWAYNMPWPDQGVDQWRGIAQAWQHAAALFLCLPAFLSLITLVRPHLHPKMTVIALHYATLLATSSIYFGGPRLRNPYDPLLIIAALIIYSEIHTKLHSLPPRLHWPRWLRRAS